MDALHQLSIESFSRSWLRNDDGGSAFIEMDPRLFSLRWSTTTTIDTDAHHIDFDFCLPTSDSPPLAHADEIIAGGRLLPLPITTSPVPLLRPEDVSSEVEVKFFARCVKSSKKIVCKCLCFLMPLWKIVKGPRPRTISSWGNSPPTSLVGGGCNQIEYDEMSIQDAVLHCKKSIGSNA